MTLQAGTRLGPYEVTAPIGAGGMGEVYRARDTKLHRDVAIKVLPELFASDPERLSRFEREAHLLASINHPNIATLFAVEETGGVTALVMELVDGETLEASLRQAPGGLPMREARGIALQLIDALDSAHERGIVHRDLKPANIKLTQAGVVKVLDFGLARPGAVGEPGGPGDELTNSPTMMRPTIDGVLLGTAPYMSPEQARGKAIDKRTDVWAFGCVLFEMLTGRRAFAGETTSDTIAVILQREPEWQRLPTETPRRVRQLLERCLDKDPKRRLRDIGDARVDLESAADPDPIDDGRRNQGVARLVPWMVAVAALVLAAAAWLRPQAPPPGANAASDAVKLTRVTWEPGLSAEPALSPDGSLVAYASDYSGLGGLDLWVQRVVGAGSAPVRITTDPADDREPDFSPDATTIAFRSDRGSGGVFVMPALGGDPRLIAPEGRTPRFSPDGTRIAYWVGRTLGGTRVPGSRAFVVASNGGEPNEVARGFAIARDPIWSSDGRKLLFFGAKTAGDDAGFDWWSVSPAGGEPVAAGVLRTLAARGFTLSPGVGENQEALPGVWTGDEVIFSAPRQHSTNLWHIDVSAVSGRTSGRLTQLTHGTGIDTDPSIDRSGHVVFQSTVMTQGVFALALDPNTGKSLGSIERLANDAALLPHRGSVSDNGRILAFPKHRPAGTELWVKDLRTKVERHVVTTPPTALNPVITPDGSRIAYAASQNGRLSTFLISASGGTARTLCEDCDPHAWMSDSRRLMLVARSAGTASRVRLVDVESGAGEDVFEGGGGRPTPTRDGRWLSVGGLNRVSIAPLRPGLVASPETAVTFDLGGGSIVDGRHTGWSPDGGLLYLLLGVDGFRCLYALRIDRTRGTPIGEPFAVHHFHEAKGGVSSTPEGTAIIDRAFIYDGFESSGSIWLLDATGPR